MCVLIFLGMNTSVYHYTQTEGEFVVFTAMIRLPYLYTRRDSGKNLAL